MNRFCNCLTAFLLVTFLLPSLTAQESGSLEGQLEKIRNRMAGLSEHQQEIQEMTIALEVKLDQYRSRVEPINDNLEKIKQALALLSPHLDSPTSVEINGQEMTPDKIREMSTQLVEEYQRLADQAHTYQTSIDAMNLGFEQLQAQRTEIENYRRKVNSMIKMLGTKVEALGELEDLDLANRHVSGLRSQIEESLDALESSMTELLESSASNEQEPQETSEEEWIQLFNGSDMEGWTPKIRGYELGDNFANTFRVEDGLLKVGYEGYEDGFQRRFGHLFYKDELSNYDLRIEYRFTGDQVDGGPGWAIRNSGVMLHCQDPATIGKDQDFPVSIEMQMLGGDGTNPRTNANVCTPGTHLEMNGELVTKHCHSSSSETYHGEQWVTVEVEVRGDEVIRHKIDGVVVLEYQKPQLDPGDADSQKLIVDGNVSLTGGYISLQSESHPIEFRKVELRKIEDSDE